MGNKGKVLYFDTDYTAELKDAEIKNGNIIIDNATEHVVDNINPVIFKTGLISNSPLYVVKWNTITPIQFKTITKRMTPEQAEQYAEDNDFIRIEQTEQQKTKGFLRRIKRQKSQPQKIKYKVPTMYEYRKLEKVETDLEKIKITPALLKETNDLRFLKNMKKYAMGKDGDGGMGKGKVIALSIGSMVFGIVFILIILASMGVGF
jgi:hypothetical protein